MKTNIRICDGTTNPNDFERLFPGQIGDAHDVGHRYRHAPRHSCQTGKITFIRIPGILRYPVFNATMDVCLPMDQNVSAAKTSSMNEVVAHREILRQVLIGTVGGQDA